MCLAATQTEISHLSAFTGRKRVSGLSRKLVILASLRDVSDIESQLVKRDAGKFNVGTLRVDARSLESAKVVPSRFSRISVVRLLVRSVFKDSPRI